MCIKALTNSGKNSAEFPQKNGYLNTKQKPNLANMASISLVAGNLSAIKASQL